jgi:glycosyltransferase involved in cell wall biosynthesis
MARVAIVSYDIQTIFGKAGGVGAFCTRWANLLRAAGDDVTIVMTRIDWEPMRVDPEWRARYQMNGIGLIELQAPPGLPTRWPEVPTMRVSEIAAPVLAGFDIVYFQDWGNAAFHLVRERRYTAAHGPVCVTVLHGPSEWELSSNHRYPELPGDMHLNYQERYAARYSDFVVSPSAYMVGELRRRGWEFPGAVEVLGLPMPEAAIAAVRVAGGRRIRRVVYFGRVEERKGIRNFVKAMQSLAGRLVSKPEVVLLGRSDEPELQASSLLASSLRGLRDAGYKVTHEGGLDSEGAMRYLAASAAETLCVVPSPSDNHPYAMVEASLIAGLHVIACRGGGVPEILSGAAKQLSGPLPQDLAALIAESIETPLDAKELAHYDCAAANERWLAFHRRALAAGAARPAKVLPPRSTVDVCTTYYRKGPYLGQFVEALEQQTEPDFHVIAGNDGSPDELSNRIFAEYAEKTRARGWDFYRDENRFVDAARNHAAARGTGELLLFVDSDDVPAPNAVARMREAMDRSGDDAIVCGSYLFASEGRPVDPVTHEVLVPAFATCIPLGMDLVGGLVNPCAFGGSMFIVKRTVFEAMGGYRELRGAGHEDWELYVRLTLAGYKVDVLPELLQFYRQVEGSLARTLPAESAKRRLLDAYEQELQGVGLQGGALALAGLYRSTQAMKVEIARLSSRLEAPEKPYAFFSGFTGKFESEGAAVGKLRELYRKALPMETRLKLHKVLLAPFFGDYKPPRP